MTEAILVLEASQVCRVETENLAGMDRRARKAYRANTSFRRARYRRAPSKARRANPENTDLGACLVVRATLDSWVSLEPREAREIRVTSETLVTAAPTARKVFLVWLVAREKRETTTSARREMTASQESPETWDPLDRPVKWVIPDCQ